MKPTKYEPMNLLKELKPVDEIELPLKHLLSVRSAITRLHKTTDKSFTTKKVSDKLFILRREK